MLLAIASATRQLPVARGEFLPRHVRNALRIVLLIYISKSCPLWATSRVRTCDSLENPA